MGCITSPFDAIRHESDQHGEYWSGKELYKLLGYSSWERFKGTIERAKIACEEAKQAVSDHFHVDVKMITAGKGAKHKLEDIYLSRYACYLVLQNADPNRKLEQYSEPVEVWIGRSKNHMRPAPMRLQINFTLM